VYGIRIPEQLARHIDVTHVSNGVMSQDDPPWKHCEIVLRLPADSSMPTIGGLMRRLPDGCIEAGYSVEQMATALSFFVEKVVDAKQIAGASVSQLHERLVAVTGGEVLHIRLSEQVEEPEDVK